jgi:hypothetical protein
VVLMDSGEVCVEAFPVVDRFKKRHTVFS